MSTPHFPETQDEAPTNKPISWQTKAIFAAVVVALALVIALHVAHVFGP